MSNRVIAAEVGVSDVTVGRHVRDIDADSRAQARIGLGGSANWRMLIIAPLHGRQLRQLAKLAHLQERRRFGLR